MVELGFWIVVVWAAGVLANLGFFVAMFSGDVKCLQDVSDLVTAVLLWPIFWLVLLGSCLVDFISELVPRCLVVDSSIFARDELSRLQAGELIVVNGRRYRICDVCWQIVRVNKPLIGSWHICPLQEEE